MYIYIYVYVYDTVCGLYGDHPLECHVESHHFGASGDNVTWAFLTVTVSMANLRSAFMAG